MTPSAYQMLRANRNVVGLQLIAHCDMQKVIVVHAQFVDELADIIAMLTTDSCGDIIVCGDLNLSLIHI